VCDLSKPAFESDIESLFEQMGQINHIVYTAGGKLASGPLESVTLDNIIKAEYIKVFSLSSSQRS